MQRQAVMALDFRSACILCLLVKTCLSCLPAYCSEYPSDIAEANLYFNLTVSPIRNSPSRSSAASRTSWTAACMSCRILRTCLSKTSPAGVHTQPEEVRSRRGAPTSASSVSICFFTAAGVTKSTSAARLKLRFSTTVKKVSILAVSIHASQTPRHCTFGRIAHAHR